MKGVRALWVLDDTSEVVIAPATHKASLPPPSLARMEELDTTVRPALQAGDLLLLAATSLFGLRPDPAAAGGEATPRIVELLLADSQLTAPGLGYVERPLSDMPDWMAELTDEQRAAVAPGVLGAPGAALDTDGTTVALVPGLETDEAVAELAAGKWRETIGSDLSAEEMWQWDAQGYIIARGAMDSSWLSAANAALDTYRNDPAVAREIGDSELWQEPECTPTLRPAGWESGEYQNEERMGGLEALPAPHGEPFRRMIAHPAVVERLNWMLGPGWHEGMGSASVNRPGAGGQQIHGGPFYGRAHGYYFDHVQGRPHSIQINYAYSLRDVNPGDGGFCLVPGSHRMRHPIPRPPTLSIDLPAVKHLTQRAGDIVFYNGGSTTHGVMSWKGAEERRSVLKSAGPRSYPSSSQPARL